LFANTENTDIKKEMPDTPDHTLLRGARVLTRNVVEDKKQKYFLYIPSGGGSGKPVFVTVHGVKRMAIEHAVEFSAFAELYDVVLVAPLFPKKQFCDYQRLGRQGRGNRADLALHRILNDVGSLTGANIDKLYMFGYSGGGQFVHRYAMAYPRHAVRIVVAAAGWYTFPDSDVNYPRGVKKAKGLDNIRFDPVGFLSVPTCVVVGKRDIHRDQELNKSGRIDRQQGVNRFERGKAWIEAMADAARSYHLDTAYIFKKIPACNHCFMKCMHRGRMGSLVFNFLFGHDPRERIKKYSDDRIDN
jgi:pimeloyl-ACP methyl ester carboxylesterase